ncbi:hypothetical protein [Microbacterium sp. SSM24]|uniref:hypothetical protein n=1 Tax=Microbacterium sp. SSM24 TaxID=2991714 RepID=UPI002226648F|nr:hypothetical protein [Microbacterium sp. SSM24]MCW3494792.1 hypothetical protein [Microbacterium sp. SSM24]
MLVNMLRSDTERDERGSALVSVLVIMLVLSIGGLALAAIVTNTTSMLVQNRTTVQSRAAADAGLSEAIAQGRRAGGVCAIGLTSTSAPRYTVSSSCSGGKVTITSTGFGEDGGTTVTNAVYSVTSAYQGLDGALVSASGSLNVSSIDVQSATNDGDIILNTGNFDCNNSMEVDGDLIVRNGSVSLSNACLIRGDLMASGNIVINNNAVGVGGKVVTLGSFSLTTGATVTGDVFARGTATVNSGGKVNGGITAVGNVTISGSATRVGGSIISGGAIEFNAATVVGSIVTSSTSDASFYKGTVGSVRVAGRFSSFQETSVTGSVESTRAGQSNSVTPGTVIGGALRVAGTISTWGAGPSAAGGITQNATGLVVPTAPTVPTPYELTTEAFVWTDLPYADTAWTGAGYTVLPAPGGCDFQNVAANVAIVNARTTPTLYDARSCSDVKMYNVTFNLKTDIAFVLKSASAQRLKINSADGQPHQFHLISPDATVNQLPTCASGYGTIVLSDVAMAPLITGAAYSPCTISIGQSSGGSRWNGQIYAGTVAWGGNSTPRMILDYKEVDLPGFDPAAGGGGGGGVTTTLGALVSQRDVP